MRFRSVVRFTLCLLAASALISTARADTFNYNYTFYDGVVYFNFTYSSPALITTDEASLTPNSCMAAGSTCTSVGILAESGGIRVGPPNSLIVNDLPLSFFQLGSNVYGFDSLSIVDQVGAAATPEPSGLILLSTGLLGTAFELKRRAARAFKGNPIGQA